jgi:hypothetical protein
LSRRRLGFRPRLDSAFVPSRYLAIYLNDHLAGATGGLELARRALRENEARELGEFLRGLVAEIAEDRETLLDVMKTLGVKPSRLKATAGWLLEKLGRAKSNGHLTSYSPLSPLLEFEGLAAGIEAKRALWLALEHAADVEGFDFASLAERARSQRERLEPFRLTAAAEALA